jgi:hypothetical protein
MSYIPDSVVADLREPGSLAICFRLGTTPPLHLWLGVHDLAVEMIGHELADAGLTYKGAGRLVSIPELEVLMNGTAERAEFYVDGVSPEFLARLDAEAPSVAGAIVQVGLTTLDDRWRARTPIIPVWRGRADYWQSEQQPQTDISRPAVHVVSLSVGSGETTRSTPTRSMWSHAQQQALAPGDRFCSRTSRYARGYQPRWPRYG